MEVTIIRESTKETRAAILKSAMEVFLEVGYQEASMRKIAARAGITAGAIYKHFSGKEEMFDEIFEESGRKLMEVTESMIGIDFTAMSDDELLNVLYSRISVHIFDMLEGDNTRASAVQGEERISKELRPQKSGLYRPEDGR